jgi:hypothetical protein
MNKRYTEEQIIRFLRATVPFLVLGKALSA